MLNVYLITLAGIALGQLLPGPNLLAVASAALSQGRREAFFVASGIATAIFVWVALASLGLGALLAVFPSLLTALKLIGGVYFCYLSVRALRSATRGVDPIILTEQAHWTSIEAWRRGLLVNLTNPKSALMWSAVASFLFGSGLSAAQVLGFAPIGFSSALIIYSAYGLLFSSTLITRTYARFTRIVEAIFALAFGAIGGSLIINGAREASS